MPEIPPTDYENLPWDKLAAVVPIATSAFAFSFVVGYFYAFDVAWFPLFTLSEHLVFALRALPIAVGASVGLLIALELSKTAYENNFSKRVSQVFSVLWTLLLVGAGVWILLSNHFGTALSLWLMAVGTVLYRWRESAKTKKESVESRKQSTKSRKESTEPKREGGTISYDKIIFWITNMMIATMMIGYASGHTWRLPGCLESLLYSRAIAIKVNGQDHGHVGHVIFAGTESILFYDFKEKTTFSAHRNKDTVIFECPRLKSMQDASCLDHAPRIPVVPPS
jgi:hypothetical protein